MQCCILAFYYVWFWFMVCRGPVGFGFEVIVWFWTVEGRVSVNDDTNCTSTGLMAWLYTFYRIYLLLDGLRKVDFNH